MHTVSFLFLPYRVELDIADDPTRIRLQCNLHLHAGKTCDGLPSVQFESPVCLLVETILPWV